MKLRQPHFLDRCAPDSQRVCPRHATASRTASKTGRAPARHQVIKLARWVPQAERPGRVARMAWPVWEPVSPLEPTSRPSSISLCQGTASSAWSWSDLPWRKTIPRQSISGAEGWHTRYICTKSRLVVDTIPLKMPCSGTLEPFESISKPCESAEIKASYLRRGGEGRVQSNKARMKRRMRTAESVTVRVTMYRKRRNG
jgi:hypothetical protein